MEVINVSVDKLTAVEEFLTSVPGIKIDVEVIMNASLLLDNDKIVGIISFESFGRTGLIRYFIFKQIVDEGILLSLFTNLVDTAIKKEVSRIIALVSNEDTIPIFEFLGFKLIDSKQIYIEEKKILNETNKLPSIYEYII